MHLSPGSPGFERGDWTLNELKNIAQAAVYFEDALEVLTPESRRASSSSGWGHQPDRPLQGLGTKHQDKLEGSSWDFTDIYRAGGTGTVEFRRPPGVVDAEGCLAWAELAVDFVQSARWPGFCAAGIGGYPQTVEGLEQFCYDGVMEEVSNKKYLETLFEGKSGALAARCADDGTGLSKEGVVMGTPEPVSDSDCYDD